MMQRISSILTVIFFILFIGFPILNSGNWLVADIRNFENRRLAQLPDPERTEIDSLPVAVERFYNDQFTQRARLIRAYNELTLLLWRKSPCPEFVIIGRAGWLFLSGEEHDVWSGKITFKRDELELLKSEFERRASYLAQRHCSFYVMIVPVKAAIYPEFLPFERTIRSGRSGGEQVADYLRTGNVKVVNLYEMLRREKRSADMYYQADNHWTRLGALKSANLFLSAVSADDPRVHTFAENEFRVVAKDSIGGNTADVLGLPDLYERREYYLALNRPASAKNGKKAGYIHDEKFPYPWMYEQVMVNPSVEGPDLLIISDSFGTYLFPILAERFHRTVKIWDNWEYKLNEDIVESEKPGVVLLVIHEKNLKGILTDLKSKGGVQ